MNDKRAFSFLSRLKGVTIVELAIIIMVLALAVPPLMILFAHIGQRSIESEFRMTAYQLAEGLLEEVLSKRFDESSSAPWSATLGPDSGESARSAYDDVDDFDGYTENPVSGFPGFSRSVTVYYVDPDAFDLDTVRPDSAGTDYKRIDVVVAHSKIGSAKFSSVRNANR
ncbi:MAG: hypothetical protein JW844_00205 [Candidatus Omnitrophica bacterium]|nr:hypothetical protein [Candidatus Omnitrophota bacterium]